MNKKILLLFTALTALTFQAFTEEEKLNIVILPVLNNTDHIELDKAADKIRSVSTQTLNLLGKYTVKKTKNVIRPEEFMTYCESNSTDYIIFGNISRIEKKIITELSLYSSSKNKIIRKWEETANSPIELRTSVNNIVSRTLSYLSAIPVYFTSLAFTNMTDEIGDYYIYIDDILFGKNIDYLESLLSGKRNIKIVQERIFGPYSVSEITTDLLPDDRVAMEFKIPPLLKKEEKYLNRYTKTLNNHLDDKYYSQKTAGSFSKLFKLLENPSFSTTAVRTKKEVSKLYVKWQKNMKEWDTEKGLTVADKPFSLGFKTMSLLSSFNITDWDMGGADPEKSSKTARGYGFTGSADIFKYAGFQTEVLVCNQKTKTDYPDPYMPGNFSEIETSTWFLEAPAIFYFRVPENLFKIYGGVSYKYRVTPLNITGIDAGESKSSNYDDEFMIMHLPSWLTGVALEIPFSSGLFVMDFRYNRDFKSWFRSGTPEEDYIADYIAVGLGYTAKY